MPKPNVNKKIMNGIENAAKAYSPWGSAVDSDVQHYFLSMGSTVFQQTACGEVFERVPADPSMKRCAECEKVRPNAN